MRSLYPVTVGTAICAVMISACGRNKHPKAESPTPIVDVIVADTQTIQNRIEVNGTVVANQFVEIHPDVAGRLTYVNIREGKPVKKGEVIAKIFNNDLVAQLNKSKASLQLAILTEQRLKKLLEINGVNQADYDSAVNAVKSNEADIQYYQALIDKTILRAPFTGVMGLRRVSVGAYVANTDIIATLQQTDSLKVDFTLPDEYSSVIQKGDKIEVTPDGSEVKLAAHVIAMEPQVNTNTRNIQVRALIGNKAANIGAFVKVYVDAGENTAAIQVPTSAIIPDDQNNKIIVVKDGKSTYRNVKTGVRQANNIEITDGLHQGDTVAVTGILFTRVNGAVKVRKVMKLADVGK